MVEYNEDVGYSGGAMDYENMDRASIASVVQS